MDDKTSECISAIENAAYGLGIIAGIKMAARQLREKSASAWEMDMDESTKLYKNTAQEFEKLARIKQGLHDDGARIEKDAARVELGLDK